MDSNEPHLLCMIAAAAIVDAALAAKPDQLFTKLADAHRDLTRAIADPHVSLTAAVAAITQFVQQAENLKSVAVRLQPAAKT